MLFLFIVLTIVFGGITLFLAKEMLKKFNLIQDWAKTTHQLIEWNYPGAEKSAIKPGMHVLSLNSSEPFSALIGFELKILWHSGLDIYGFADSGEETTVYIKTYLGKGPGKLQFLINKNVPVKIKLLEASKYPLESRLLFVFPPHWWQKFM